MTCPADTDEKQRLEKETYQGNTVRTAEDSIGMS